MWALDLDCESSHLRPSTAGRKLLAAASVASAALASLVRAATSRLCSRGHGASLLGMLTCSRPNGCMPARHASQGGPGRGHGHPVRGGDRVGHFSLPLPPLNAGARAAPGKASSRQVPDGMSLGGAPRLQPIPPPPVRHVPWKPVHRAVLCERVGRRPSQSPSRSWGAYTSSPPGCLSQPSPFSAPPAASSALECPLPAGPFHSRGVSALLVCLHLSPQESPLGALQGLVGLVWDGRPSEGCHAQLGVHCWQQAAGQATDS